MLQRDPVILVLGPAGLDTARRIQTLLPDAHIHGLTGRVPEAEQHFEDTTAHLRRLFERQSPIIGICASGIVIRALAPTLSDKHNEPPVLTVAADGSAVVPLLGGHHGANDLARKIARGLACDAAVTTAGDVTLDLALDEPPAGWKIANPNQAKPVMAALLAGDLVKLTVDSGDPAWLTDSGVYFARVGDHEIRVTHLEPELEADALIVHPPVLALGVGCERGADAGELEILARETLAEHGLSPLAVACVCSLDLKSDEAAVLALAESLNVPARFFTAAELERETPRLTTPSETVFREVGCHGVAEAAALAAAGRDGKLLVPKHKTRSCTVACALAPGNLDPDTIGRPRGRLAVIGLGPGRAESRTVEVQAAIRAATDLVGYRLYIDLLGNSARNKTVHAGRMGEEEQRVRLALDLASQGKQVALVCSGDAGIYALASLVFELMDRATAEGFEEAGAWSRIDIEVFPGVTALQAAAGRFGAPIGHDFCAISLSDLLTPWAAIETRITAAAEADFVIGFYNPASRERTEHLDRAADILRRYRAPETPVLLAREIGRAEETIMRTTLATLTSGMADMRTLVIVGNSETRNIRQGERTWTYTPRGYGNRERAAAGRLQRQPKDAS